MKTKNPTKTKRIKINYLLIPVPNKEKGELGLLAPTIKGFEHITLKRVKVEGKYYDKFEYIPKQFNLCSGGNAKRKGSFIYPIENN